MGDGVGERRGNVDEQTIYPWVLHSRSLTTRGRNWQRRKQTPPKRYLVCRESDLFASGSDLFAYARLGSASAGSTRNIGGMKCQ